VSTFQALEAQLAGLDSVNGITPVDILLLPEALRPVVRRMLRRAVALPELAAELVLSESEARQVADTLVQKGFLQTQGEEDSEGVVYKVHFSRMHAHNIPPEL
jgi:hypothetical protein